jgi:DNA-binding transcriptional LysR family regulator
MQVVIDWNDLRFLQAVRDRGTLAAASETLRVDATTVRRRIDALERALGIRLVERTKLGVSLTVAGERAYAAAARASGEFEALERELRDGDRRLDGVVQLTATDTLVAHYLPAQLVAFREQHPQIALVVRADSRELDVAGGESDVAVRLARPAQERLIARKVGRMAFALYASPAYLASHRPLAAGRGFADHELLIYDRWQADARKNAQLSRWLEGARIAMIANTLQALLPAAAAGGGLAILPCFVADADPRLRRAQAPAEVPACEMWLIARRAQQRVARVRALLEFLAAAFARDAAMLRGRS